MNKRKVLQTFICIFVLVVTLVSWGTYRIALATEDGNVSEVTATKIEDLEDDTGEEVAEAVTEAANEEAVTTELVVEASSAEEATSEITENAEKVSTEVTEITTEAIEVAENTESSTELTTEENSTEEVTAEETGEKNVEIEESIEQYDDTKYYVTAYKSFGNGHYWHRIQGTSIDIFCLSRGLGDTGTYWTRHNDVVYGSKATSYRLATALLWYKKNGATEENYKATQDVVWNLSSGGTQGVTDKMNTIKDLSSKLYKIYSTSKINDLKTVTKNKDGSFSGSLTQKKVSGTKYTLNITDSNMQWLIKKGYLKYSTAVNGGGYTGTVTAKLGKEGKKIDFTFNPALTSGQTVSVYFIVDCPYFSDGKMDYLKANNNAKQDFAITSTKVSQYRGIKFTTSAASDQYFPTFGVHKTTPDGITANAEYKLVWAPWSSETDQTTYDFGAVGMTFSSDEVVELADYVMQLQASGRSTEGKGHYYVYEVATDENLVLRTTQITHFMMGSVTSGGTVYYYIYDNDINKNYMAAGWSDGQNWYSGGPLKYAKYTNPNDYAPGSVKLIKKGNALVGYDRNEATGEITFKYEQKLLDGINFKLYTNENIKIGTVDWPANTCITSGVTWSKQPGCTVNYTGITDAKGEVTATGLPEGSYYFVEDGTSPIYLTSDAKYEVTVSRDKQTDTVSKADTTPTAINLPLSASVTVIKEDAENQEKLAGAHFTLYASVKNTDFSGKQLFPDSLAEKAVIARNNETGTESTEDGWVKIQTVVSDEEGKATFQELPYGDYLVVETKSPNGYSLPNESWKFTHTKDNAASTTIYATSVDYSHTFTFGNKQKYNIITTYKHGKTITGAIDKDSDYGSYKKLVTEDKPMGGVTFAIYNEKGTVVDTFVTDEHGIAKSADLPKGVYKVKEVSCDKLHKVSPEIKTVTFSGEDETKTVEFNELDFEDELITTQLSMYKNGEVPYVTNEVLEKTEQYSEVVVEDESSAYTFNVEPLAETVFGVYAAEDFKNDAGDVIIRIDDCVGYAVTNENGIAVLNEQVLPGNYRFKEIQSAEDYRLAEDEFAFAVDAASKDIDLHINPTDPIVNVHKKSALKLVKQDGESEKPLEGVEFELFNSDDVFIGTYITDENGEIYVADVPLDRYYFKETKPLDGYYEYTDEIEFNVTEDGMEYSITAYNDKIPDKPKLGTFGFVDVFCSILLVLCSAAITFIWVPFKKKS